MTPTADLSPVLAIVDQGGIAVLHQSREQRLYEIERALKMDPDRDYRRELIREYLNLTDPETEADFL